jgi:hypothetical protein
VQAPQAKLDKGPIKGASRLETGTLIVAEQLTPDRKLSPYSVSVLTDAEETCKTRDKRQKMVWRNHMNTR